jgi:hypothetical protein
MTAATASGVGEAGARVPGLGQPGRAGRVPLDPLPPDRSRESAGQDRVDLPDRRGRHRTAPMRPTSGQRAVVIRIRRPGPPRRREATLTTHKGPAPLADHDQPVTCQSGQCRLQRRDWHAVPARQLRYRRQPLPRAQPTRLDRRPDGVRDLLRGRSPVPAIDCQRREPAVLGEGPPGTAHIPAPAQPGVERVQVLGQHLGHLHVRAGPGISCRLLQQPAEQNPGLLLRLGRLPEPQWPTSQGVGTRGNGYAVRTARKSL